MSLFQTWGDVAKNVPQQKQNEFWNAYFTLEQNVYEQILSQKSPIQGQLGELAQRFDMEPFVFCGFMDGINTSLANGEIDLDALTEESEISLDVDLKKLYYNMLCAKAKWLYNLPAWDERLPKETQREILQQYRAEGVYVAPPKVGRNDPCPCGSGRKYRHCCGRINTQPE